VTAPQPPVLVPERPVLVTVPSVELIHTGTWDISTGTWTVTTEDLVNVVAALDCPAVRRPIIKIGHTDPRFDGEPAIGWLDNLAVSATGHELRGDYTGIPAWLRDVLASAYPDRSIEGEYEHVCQLHHVHPFVLTGVALLGVSPPGVGTLESLQDVAALFGVAAAGPTGARPFRIPIAAGGSVMPNATVVAASATVEQVRRSFYDGPGTGWDIWIEEFYVDPAEIIAVNDADATLWRHGFTVAADGTVTWAEPQQVKREYVAAATTVRAPTMTWASRTESRAGVARASEPPPATTPAPAPTGETPVSSTLDSIVRERLGLDPDASDEDVTAALNEQLPAEAPAVEPPAVPAAPAVTPPAGDNGVVQIDAGQLAALQAAAQLGAQAHARQQLADRQQLVDAAVNDGRIPPARRDHWLAQLEADPGAATTLAKLAPGLVPVAEAGHGANPHAAAGGDADLGWFPNLPAPKHTQKEG
jgi:hypothetical protein